MAVSGEGDDTTYGFEVQPIQEYFAASYISNRLPNGTAHEVFELLVHRNYWREVALFLAGLRRPNEKADWVVRAKEADRQESRGWQQNGRAIVLQLLREGVLQQPGHVLREAMDFIVDLLDISTLRIQRTPDGLVETVARLGPLYPNDGLCKRIARIADSYEDWDDEYALAAIHRVAARLLPRKEYARLVWRYRGNHEAQSLVRMTCPYESPETLEDLARGENYWAGVPVLLWARRFWRAALQHGVVVVDVEPLAKLLGSRLGSVLRFSGVNTPLSWISTACSGPEGPAASQETENKGIDVFSTERGDTGG